MSEAKRIEVKHLATLEPGISENQTDEMRDKSLRLVVPVAIQSTYRESQRAWLLSVRDFITLVRARDGLAMT